MNCDKNKMEIIMIYPSKNAEQSSNNVVPIFLGAKHLYYAEKSRVLGVVIDKDLLFDQQARPVLSRCWQLYLILLNNYNFHLSFKSFN